MEHKRPSGSCRQSQASAPGVGAGAFQKPPWFTGSGYRHRGRSDSGVGCHTAPTVWPKKRESSFAIPQPRLTPCRAVSRADDSRAGACSPPGRARRAARAHRLACGELWRAVRYADMVECHKPRLRWHNAPISRLLAPGAVLRGVDRGKDLPPCRESHSEPAKWPRSGTVNLF